MSARCEPPAELRGVDGWHWVCAVGLAPYVSPITMRWGARAQGWWHEEVGMRGHNAEEAADDGWRYVAPVATPAEVDALTTHRDNARLEIIRWSLKCAELEAEVKRLRGALDELVSACELPGDHCEVEQALPRARAALSAKP